MPLQPQVVLDNLRLLGDDVLGGALFLSHHDICQWNISFLLLPIDHEHQHSVTVEVGV